MGQLRDQLNGRRRARAALQARAWGAARVAVRSLLPSRRLVAAALCAAAALGAPSARGSVAAEAKVPAAPAPVERVTGGASSLDELVERFLAALRAGDADALEALRLTRDEYVHLVMPGHVPPGQPPQALSPEAAEYFYDVMDTKSRHFRTALLTRFGGRPLELHEITFEKGVAQYAGHRSHKRTALWLREADGSLVELRTGSVVERDGRFKFASYIRD